MALKITCPNCGEPHRLSEPFPLPGAEVQCRACRRPLTISYPSGLMARLRAKGAAFQDEPLPVSAASAPPPPTSPSPAPPPAGDGWLRLDEPPQAHAPPHPQPPPQAPAPPPEPAGPPRVEPPKPKALPPPAVAPPTRAAAPPPRPAEPVAASVAAPPVPRPRPAILPPPPVVPATASHHASPPPPPVIPTPEPREEERETVLERGWSRPTAPTEQIETPLAELDEPTASPEPVIPEPGPEPEPEPIAPEPEPEPEPEPIAPEPEPEPIIPEPEPIIPEPEPEPEPIAPEPEPEPIIPEPEPEPETAAPSDTLTPVDGDTSEQLEPPEPVPFEGPASLPSFAPSEADLPVVEFESEEPAAPEPEPALPPPPPPEPAPAQVPTPPPVPAPPAPAPPAVPPPSPRPPPVAPAPAQLVWTPPVRVDPPAPPATIRTVEPLSPPRAEGRATPRPKALKSPKQPAPPPTERPRRSLGTLLLRLTGLLVVLGLIGIVGVAGLFWYYSRELPTVEALGQYRPPTVTVVHDREGRVLGEIYEKRRYVVELEQIPKHVQDAFVAAEDANFWQHTGIDVGGIFRAAGRNLAKGKAAQGASTITQQVARNFLLTSEKTVTRKIKEVILARRIEGTFDKKHILYLYLNQIYLGSGAYGVEAAARTYFDKHVQDLSLAEAAILAGLPQRPSDYSPLIHWDKARARQEYVLTQLLEKGYIDKATHDATLATPVDIVRKENPFLAQAPYFTEHVRRYLVETYGFEKVYNDGLSVDTTCDLDLQKAAQQAVVEGADRADNRVGWRGPLGHVEEAEIRERLDLQEKALREEQSKRTLRVAAQESPEAGYGAMPDQSTLEKGRRYEAVVLEVAAKHVVVGVGRHKALIPLSWSTWTYKPNPDRSWKGRAQDDLTRVVARGDLVEVTIEGLSSEEFDNLKGYTAAGPGPFAAAKIFQAPALESALLSYRLQDGAVLAMVGGVDFEKTEYNRATQAQRQVGSTFKPIVYAAAIESKKFTAGSIVQDAPLVFNVLDEKLWKPDNYGEDFLGNITLRKALQLSRNVCTIRVLDRIGLDVVYEMAGPRLRIGYDQPSCHRTLIPEGEACEGSTEPSPVAGRVWCTGCEPTSCPLIQSTAATSCLDEAKVEGDQSWCHSCDVNLRLCDWLAADAMPEGERCMEPRKDADGKVWCRACDLSMGLGSSSLTMVELTRAYSAFATYGRLVEPHWIDRVVDRDGTVIESWKAPEAWPEVVDRGVAAITHWLLVQVVQGGTASKAQRLGLNLAGKTGTTNDFFDAWFVGYNPDVITSVWVGYDQPRSMGQTFTGGETALPIWMDYMKEAVPKDQDRPFPPLPGVESVPIDESTGRAAKGGYPIPMLPGTAPTNAGIEVGQKTSEDLLTSDF